MDSPIRVVQWATGSIGKTCLRAVIDSPELDLVGLLVYSDRKAGRDAGEITRRSTTGVIATQNIDDILAIPADVVLHTPRVQLPYQRHDDDICRLLQSGKNVITTEGHHHPAAHGDERAALFTEAALAGGATLFGAGVSPGVIGERVVLAMSSAVLDLDLIEITEIVDTRRMPDPDFVFNVMGIGKDPVDFDLLEGDHATMFNLLFSETLSFMAEELGLTTYDIRPDHRVSTALADLDIAAGSVAKNTISTTEWRWHVVAGDRRRITLSINWTMEPDRPEFAGKPHWSINITGRPNVTMSIDISTPQDPERQTSAGQFMTAGPVVQAIPEVVAAPPGILRGRTFMTRRRASDLA